MKQINNGALVYDEQKAHCGCCEAGGNDPRTDHFVKIEEIIDMPERGGMYQYILIVRECRVCGFLHTNMFCYVVTPPIDHYRHAVEDIHKMSDDIEDIGLMLRGAIGVKNWTPIGMVQALKRVLARIEDMTAKLRNYPSIEEYDDIPF